LLDALFSPTAIYSIIWLSSYLVGKIFKHAIQLPFSELFVRVQIYGIAKKFFLPYLNGISFIQAIDARHVFDYSAIVYKKSLGA
jgi:hypothetical protein